VCELLELSASVVRGPADAPARHLQRLMDILLGAPADLWYRCMWVTAFVIRPRFQPALQRFLDEALVAAGDSHLHLRALAQFHQINATILSGDAARARVLMRRLEEDTAWLAQATRRLLFVRIHLVLLEGGDPTGMIQELIAERQTAAPRPALARNACFYLARQSANLGDWDTVRRMVALAEGHGPFPEGPFMKFPPEILCARLLLHDGDALRARELLRPLLDGLSEIDHHGTEDFVRVTLATAELRCGDAVAAWEVLRPTIDGIATTGSMMRVIMSGTDLFAELAAAKWGGAADAQRVALLNSWVSRVRRRAAPTVATGGAASSPAITRAAPPMPARMPTTVLEGLTRRELEVLERLAGGDSNKVIGLALDVSPNTVKRHVARILDRLGVDSRGQAASWYLRQHTTASAR
jgi:LuxR family maltose regulon positive regulatory protein